MIDWVTAIIPCSNMESLQINNGWFCRVTPERDIKWEKEIGKDIPGSHDSNIRISRDPYYYHTHLRIDGNPSKWFQGHNIFGSNNLIGLVNSLMEVLIEILSLNPTPNDRRLWAEGKYKLNRVDCTEMWELNNQHDVLSWLNVAQHQSRSRHGSSIMTGHTLYFGKNSRHWSFKFYSKGEEINAKKHKLPETLPLRDDLSRFADNKLRGELVLRPPVLKKRLYDFAANWTEETPRKLFNEFLNKIELSDQFKLTPTILAALKPRLMMVYNNWIVGHDLRAILPKNTFYRYRREMMEHGIDISVSRKGEHIKPVPIRDENGRVIMYQ